MVRNVSALSNNTDGGINNIKP